MSLFSTVANYGGKIPTYTQNIKQFVESPTVSQADWVFSKITPNGELYITPANRKNSVYISTDLIVKNNLYVLGNIFNPSDVKLKEEIEPISDSKIEKLFDLEPVEYKLKTDIKKKKHYGLIAQDVEKLYPELISDSNLGFKSVNYMELLPLLLLKMKNMQKEIDDLREQIGTIKNGI
jgi:hypothetical protein